jgi:hypothetical protein
MTRKTVRRSVRIRRSPAPSAKGIANGFRSLMMKLDMASAQLNRTRRRR